MALQSLPLHIMNIFKYRHAQSMPKKYITCFQMLWRLTIFQLVSMPNFSNMTSTNLWPQYLSYFDTQSHTQWQKWGTKTLTDITANLGTHNTNLVFEDDIPYNEICFIHSRYNIGLQIKEEITLTNTIQC